jgi:hypothetical protein
METIKLSDLEAQLIARKRELGLTGRDQLPRNDGTRRTESKRRLLQAIEDNARAQGREPAFKANFRRD